MSITDTTPPDLEKDLPLKPPTLRRKVGLPIHRMEKDEFFKMIEKRKISLPKPLLYSEDDKYVIFTDFWGDSETYYLHRMFKKLVVEKGFDPEIYSPITPINPDTGKPFPEEPYSTGFSE